MGYNVSMSERDEILIGLEVLSAQIKALSEKQDAQYTDVILHLKRIEDHLENAEVTAVNADELFEAAKKAVIKARKASTSFLQRKFGIGYSRAAHLLDRLEEEGVIGPGEGYKATARCLSDGASGIIRTKI